MSDAVCATNQNGGGASFTFINRARALPTTGSCHLIFFFLAKLNERRQKTEQGKRQTVEE